MAVFISELSLCSHCFTFSVGTKKRLNKHGLLLLGSRHAASVNAYWEFSSHRSIALWRLCLEAFYMEFGGEHKPDFCIVRRWRKLYMPFLASYSCNLSHNLFSSVEILIVGDDYKSMRSSGVSYSESDTESPGIRGN
ncbi:hypothetical protein F2Q70_00031921 [Brassica cretica]|uniref:Uncharacterized protein n=1 Tax=Brassica cretica TaxID=69181 RepID=A0A8S9FDP8_BRACR|nr:hypothetical protein F2Q70_00031921 [Brassica cretica]KAF3590775.1 hypothetical protein DY000_02025314 [Brassica cretica]